MNLKETISIYVKKLQYLKHILEERNEERDVKNAAALVLRGMTMNQWRGLVEGNNLKLTVEEDLQGSDIKMKSGLNLKIKNI